MKVTSFDQYNQEYYLSIFHWFSLGCEDNWSSCPMWARKGHWKRKYEAFMSQNCEKSCNLCGSGGGGGG